MKVIINGGDPLEGCPKSPEEADAIELKLNEGKQEDYVNPVWDFDCGYKLDYDGPIVRISSRFYPPKEHYGPTWDGNVTVYVLDKQVSKKSFDCPTLDELAKQVEAYVNEIREKLFNFLNHPQPLQ